MEIKSTASTENFTKSTRREGGILKTNCPPLPPCPSLLWRKHWYLGLLLGLSELALQCRMSGSSKLCLRPAKTYIQSCPFKTQTFSFLHGGSWPGNRSSVLVFLMGERALSLGWLPLANFSWRLSHPFGQPLWVHLNSRWREVLRPVVGWGHPYSFSSSLPSSFFSA